MAVYAVIGLFIFGLSQINSLLLSNTSIRLLNDLPTIKEGDPCTPYQIYRLDCNTCRCEHGNRLLCTKMVCISTDHVAKFRQKMGKLQREGSIAVEGMKKKSVGKKEKRDRGSSFPDLPEGECKPGKMYQKNCRGCFCQDDKKAVCSQKRVACDPGVIFDTPLLVRPPLPPEAQDRLPVLPTMASRCEPGKTYRVSCNTCICLPNHSLFCDQTLCLSSEDMNRIQAEKITGTNCTKDSDIQPPSCVKCTCVRGVAACKPEEGCPSPSLLRKLHGQYQAQGPQPDTTLDLNKDEKCVPEAVYKNNCNKCYCQKDGTLRCTLKVCLNYMQSLKLKKHRLYLQKHGL